MAAKRKFDLRFLIDFYDACLHEPKAEAVARALNVRTGKLRKWVKEDADLKQVKKWADERRGQRSTLSGFILGRLSPETKAMWEKIEFLQENENVELKVNELLFGSPIQMRQELFVQALLHSRYSVSEACRMVGVSKDDVYRWCNDYPGFKDMVAEIHHHKKDFFETALMQLVEQGNPGAVLFVNRTVNADRGYREQVSVDHSGTVAHIGFSFADLDLDLDTRKKVLAAVRAKQELTQKALQAPANGQAHKEEKEAIEV